MFNYEPKLSVKLALMQLRLAQAQLRALDTSNRVWNIEERERKIPF